MAEVERRWYWPMAQMGTALLGILVLSVFYLCVALPIDRRLGTLSPDALTLAIIIVLLLAIAWAEAHSARIAREEARQLREAMAGNPAAMPRADLKLPTGKLEFWLDSTDFGLLAGRRAWLGPPLVLAMAGFCLWAGAPLAQTFFESTLRIIQTNSMQVVSYPGYLPLLMLYPFISFGLLWCAGIGAVALGNMALTCGFSIRLTDEGIVYSYVGRRTRLLRWSEARLLEVTAERVPANSGRPAHWQHTYTLYSERRMVKWVEETGDLGVPSRRYAAWLELIRQHTGLEQRTRSALLIPEAATLPAPPVPVNVGFVIFAGLSVIALDLSIVEAPTSPTAAREVPLAVAAVLLFCGILWWHARAGRKWQADMASGRALAEAAVARPAPSPPPRPQPLAPGGVYEHAYYNEQHPKAARVMWSVLGVIYACAALFAITLVTVACQSDAKDASCPVHDTGSWLGFLGFVAFWAIPSVPMLSLGFAGKPAAWIHLHRMVVADADGVHTPIWPRWRRTIQWDEVATVDLIHIRGKGWRYRVISTSGSKIIVWPLQKRPRPAPITTPAATPLDADAFAELVAARSGRRLDTSMRRASPPQ